MYYECMHACVHAFLHMVTNVDGKKHHPAIHPQTLNHACIRLSLRLGMGNNITHPGARTSIHTSIHPSLPPSLGPSIHPCIHPCIHPSIYTVRTYTQFFSTHSANVRTPKQQFGEVWTLGAYRKHSAYLVYSKTRKWRDRNSKQSSGDVPETTLSRSVCFPQSTGGFRSMSSVLSPHIGGFRSETQMVSFKSCGIREHSQHPQVMADSEAQPQYRSQRTGKLRSTPVPL